MTTDIIVIIMGTTRILVYNDRLNILPKTIIFTVKK